MLETVTAVFRRRIKHRAILWLCERIGRVIDRHLHKHRRVVAVSLTVALHIAFVLLLLIDVRQGVSMRGLDGAGDNDGSGTAVALRLDAAADHTVIEAKVAAESETEDEITPLELADDALGFTVLKTDVVKDLSSTQRPPSQVLPPSTASSGGNGDNGADDDALWQAIAPCWNSMADGNTLPVTLDVSFDSTGGIASAPRIERDPARATDPRALRSETLAMQALSACGAYAMAEGRQDVKLNFPSP